MRNSLRARVRRNLASVDKVERISYQLPSATEESTPTNVEEVATPSNKVKDFDFGEILKGTFSITVKSPDEKDDKGNAKILYTNDKEAFEYEKVIGFSNLLKHAGATLTDEQIEFLNQALAGSEETGKAVAGLINIYNSKLKADAKSSAYQSLVNKYTPLEGEKKESAQARLVANFIKLAGVSKETAIETLKMGKALPEDYTVADFDATPLRRTKGDNDE